MNVRSLDQLQEYDDQGVNEHFGARVSGAGDINGDGYDDVIVLAAGEILTGCNTGGSAIYIFHGGPAGLDAAPHTILAPKNGHVFLEVAGGGDANGDGFDDIAIIDANLPATCAGTATYFPGDILVFPGSTDGVYIPPATPDSPPILAPFDVTPWLYTDNGTTFTRKPTLKFTGDVNGDGYGEFVFSTKSGINSSTSTVSILLLGNQQAANFDYLYYATGGNNSDLEPSTRPAVVAGDFNGDNYADVVFSGGRSLNPNFLGNGAAWVFYGRASIGSSATQDNATENLGELLFDQIIFLTFPIRLEGEELKAGDINGDAFTDLTIAGRTDVYLRLGTPDGIMIDHIKKPIVSAIGYGFSEQNTAMGDHTLGDVNGDGYVDIVSQYTPDLNNPTADSDDYIILYGRATDLDMDGVTDTQDAFPFDTFETVDTDGDGVGDNADVAPNDPGRTTTQPPVITPISDQIVDVGETLEVIVEVSDADGDVPTLSLMSSPAFATITGNTISLAPTAIDLGHFTITVEADDGFKGVSTLSFGVTVSDSTAPEVVVVPGPANPPYQFFIGAVDANGTPATHTEIASILEMVYAQDNVDGTIDNASIVNDAPSQFPIGDTVVTFAATDSAGNTGTNTATFTIADTTAPALVVPADISIQLDAGNSLALSDSRIASFLGGATAMDNVDGVVPVTNNAPASLALGVTTVIFAAADSSGNNSAGPSTITLTSLDNDSDGMPNSFEVANGLDQNDPADASGDLDGDGLTNLEEYEQGTDVAVDSVPPILTVPASVSIELVSGNSVSSSDSRIVDFLSGASAKDGVDGVVDVTDDAPATFGLGTTTVTFTARDAADNISSEPSTIVVTSLDNDGDGLPNSFESANGLDMNDPSDAAGDLDGDGLSNLDEYLQGGNIAVDDVDPMLTIPSDIVVNSTGPLTPVDFSGVTASDVLDGAITPVADTPGPFTPGRHIVTWIATDQAGNSATAQQIVDVIPMVSFSPSETVDEGSSVTIDVTLNGNAVAYPVSVPYTVGGTAANPADHNASSGTVEITSGTQGTITLNTVADALPEGEETIVFTLGTPVNAVPGAVSEHIVTIVETNIAPAVSLVIRQGGKPVTTVVTGAGVVELSVEINDPNPNDSHAFDWSGTDNSLVPQEGYTAATFTFDPSSLVEGIYQLATLVSDNGVPVLSADAKALINVTTTAPVLSDTSDTDGDGIADADEGISDSDMDRIPDYLDAVDEPNLLPTDTSNSAVLQTDAGLDLRLGQTAFASGSGGAQVSIDDINNHGGAAGGVASNADPNQFDFPAGIFDFEVTGLESGASARIVQPLSVAIPPDATYRKYFADTGWFDFVENADNVVSSAPGQPGVCPAPGDATYVAGLNEGNFCVQLTIEDGGPNDADASADGVVRDPGGIAVVVDANGNQDSGNGTPDNGNQNPDPGSGDGPGSNGAGSGGSDGGGGALSTTGLVFMLCWLLLVFIRTKRYDDIGDGDE
ncbi:MAG: HYR domain-containing protein [Gammaproteobacteria bacterium]